MMEYEIYINDEKTDCKCLEIQELAVPDDYEARGFDSSSELTLNFTASIQALNKLAKFYQQPKQKLTWRDIPVKGRWHK